MRDKKRFQYVSVKSGEKEPDSLEVSNCPGIVNRKARKSPWMIKGLKSRKTQRIQYAEHTEQQAYQPMAVRSIENLLEHERGTSGPAFDSYTERRV